MRITLKVVFLILNYVSLNFLLKSVLGNILLFLLINLVNVFIPPHFPMLKL